MPHRLAEVADGLDRVVLVPLDRGAGSDRSTAFRARKTPTKTPYSPSTTRSTASEQRSAGAHRGVALGQESIILRSGGCSTTATRRRAFMKSVAQDGRDEERGLSAPVRDDQRPGSTAPRGPGREVDQVVDEPPRPRQGNDPTVRLVHPCTSTRPPGPTRPSAKRAGRRRVRTGHEGRTLSQTAGRGKAKVARKLGRSPGRPIPPRPGRPSSAVPRRQEAGDSPRRSGGSRSNPDRHSIHHGCPSRFPGDTPSGPGWPTPPDARRPGRGFERAVPSPRPGCPLTIRSSVDSGVWAARLPRAAGAARLRRVANERRTAPGSVRRRGSGSFRRAAPGSFGAPIRVRSARRSGLVACSSGSSVRHGSGPFGRAAWVRSRPGTAGRAERPPGASRSQSRTMVNGRRTPSGSLGRRGRGPLEQDRVALHAGPGPSEAPGIERDTHSPPACSSPTTPRSHDCRRSLTAWPRPDADGSPRPHVCWS